MEHLVVFKDCGNYRGCLETKREEGRYYWRVTCDIEAYDPWIEIPEYLGRALKQYYDERRTQCPMN
jgi:hypothetical protein